MVNRVKKLEMLNYNSQNFKLRLGGEETEK